MKNATLQKIIITFILSFLCVSAFQIRLHNFRSSSLRTIDEIVFVKMAKQVAHDVRDYHTIPYGKTLAATGRELPEYFFAPLYKHPPVFTFMAALSMKLFGEKGKSAGYVSIFLSVLMMPLLYWLGALLFDRQVGLLAAILLWFDPVVTMTSQKVWIDTSIAFFTLLAAVLFVYALKNKNDWFFIFSGIASGLAVNTKYPGILITFGMVLYTLFYRRDLFRKGKFFLGLLMPFLMLIPWFMWNIQVYGISALKGHYELTFAIRLFTDKLWLILPVAAILFAVYLFLKRKSIIGHRPPTAAGSTIEPGTSKEKTDELDPGQAKIVLGSYIAVILFILIFIGDSVLKSLHFYYIPVTSWSQGFFANEIPSFYFKRLLEYFFIYIFAYLALFTYHPKEQEQTAFIRISTIVILFFFIAWRNFQCRYILATIPFLILLAANTIKQVYSAICSMETILPRLILRSAFILLIMYSILKVNIINYMLSYTNNMCYF
ncbi:MAG: glycosyltransferase family 39 protein [Candidatus Omnitrophica bacterium]|nr:glycosyltransferase family 39 protein [Candidatus Omnitrophota bacterium]